MRPVRPTETKELTCCWCHQTGPHVRTRMHDEGVEWKCLQCGQRFTMKEGDPDHAYLFFPGDIYALSSDDIKPLDLDR